MNPNARLPILVPPGAGRVLKEIGVTHKLLGRQTGSDYYLFESEFDPESGNRLHVHANEDEVVYVIQGTIRIRLENEVLEVGEGGVAHLPRGIAHGLYNPGQVPLRILALAIPGGMEHFFDELEAAILDGSMDDRKHREISRKYGIDWLE